MEPMGTITKYYPFLKQETRKILEDIVANALDYRDFVCSLIESSKYPGCDEELFQFAVVQATSLCGGYDDEVWDMIFPLVGKRTTTKPWTKWNNPVGGGTQRDPEGFHKMIEDAVEAAQGNWFRFHIIQLAAYRAPTWQDYYSQTERGLDLVKQYPELRPLLPPLHLYNVFVKNREGNTDEALEECERAVEITRESNDISWLSHALRVKGEILRDFNPNQALTVLEEAHILAKSLGDSCRIGNVARNMGDIYTQLGQYDAAVACIVSGVDLSSKTMKVGRPKSGFIAVRAANLYCDLDELDQAKEWIKWFKEPFDETDWKPDRYLELVTARVLLLAGEQEEGTMYLNMAHKKVIKSGVRRDLGMYNFVLGLGELTSGDYTSALLTLEQALNESQGLKDSIQVNRCLIALAKTEIEITKSTIMKERSSISDKWISRLEQHVLEKEYPGIRMQSALLKAEYEEVIGEYEDAYLTLKDTLSITDSSGAETLKSRILKRLDELESHVDA
ncbi:MAG: hypothetical protein RTU63_04945 [Candidatus Thorarchaeota archaeon]